MLYVLKIFITGYRMYSNEFFEYMDGMGEEYAAFTTDDRII